MTTYEFTLALQGALTTDDDAAADAVYTGGCDDGMYGVTDGAAYITFDREADVLAQAVESAIEQVSAINGLEVVRIEPDDLVTAADIAERLKVSRQVVSYYIAGQRGAGLGPFPLPVSHLSAQHRLWSWAEVTRWKAPGSELAMEAQWVADRNRQLFQELAGRAA